MAARDAALRAIGGKSPAPEGPPKISLATPAGEFVAVETPTPYRLGEDWEKVPSTGTLLGGGPPAEPRPTPPPLPENSTTAADGTSAPFWSLPKEGPHVHPLLNVTPPE